MDRESVTIPPLLPLNRSIDGELVTFSGNRQQKVAFLTLCLIFVQASWALALTDAASSGGCRPGGSTP
jgi:hypothetical protein